MGKALGTVQTLVVISLDSSAGEVRHAQVELCLGQAMKGGQIVPVQRLFGVQGNALAVGVGQPEIELCLGVTGLGENLHSVEIGRVVL